MKVDFDTRMMWLSWIALDSMRNLKPGEGVLKLLRTQYDKILADDFLWQDLVLRHNFVGVKPWNAKAKDAVAFDHAMGNFWGMVNAMKYDNRVDGSARL